jgi:cyclic pyranopterin phosphate synthase
MELSHVDDEGRAVMVDVSGKPRVRRTATAAGKILMDAATVRLIRENLLKKGDALAVARVAGINAAKRTAELIPLCHNIRIDQVTVDFALADDGVEISAAAVCTESTGIEMEALTAVSVAALTLYDMCKAVDKGMRIIEIRLLEKTKDAPSRGPFTILSINVSERTGCRKTPVERAVLREGHGIVGDAHAGTWHRQVSLLAEEDIDGMRGRGIEIGFGDFAENITTRGVDLGTLPVGTRISMGDALLEITQIGKECHNDCAIFKAVGDCVMPRRGVFARVLRGGEVSSESVCHYGV